MKKYFGTDGIRGKVGEKIMNAEMAKRLGMAMVFYCRKENREPKILIGRDTRWSGEDLQCAVLAGIQSESGEAVLAGVIPTPGLAFLTKAGDYSIGLEISASHNDASFNGFKLFTGDGDKLNEAEEHEMEKEIDKAEKIGDGDKTKDKLKTEIIKDDVKLNKVKIMEDALVRYETALIKNFSKDFSAQGLKIVLDCAQGATYAAAPEIFKKLGAEVVAIFNEPDGKNINDNCGSQYPQKLQVEVVKQKADLGLAFDGDGDRVIAVDETGKLLNGDQLLYIFARMLKEKGELGENALASTVMSNLGLANALQEIGVRHLYTGVGDQLVYEAMKKSGAVIGGEESGHIIFRSHLSSGDGILTGLKLLEAMEFFKKPLSALAQELSFYPKILKNVKVKSKPELSGLPEIDKIIKEAENHFGQNGRVIIRYSGTEPLCRVMIEGQEEGEVKEWCERIANEIEKQLN